MRQKFASLALATVMLLSGCHAFRDESAAPLRGRLVLEVVPNPMIARPLGDDFYEVDFDIVMREEGGVGLRIEDFTIEAVAFRTVTVSAQTFPGAAIDERGYPSTIDAGNHLRFHFTRRWHLPTRLLLSGASARVSARTIDANGSRSQSTVRVGVLVGDPIAPQGSTE